MSAQPHVTCREVIDFLFAYVDNTLDAAKRDEFRKHLSICKSCRAYLATYEVTVRAGRNAVRYDDAADEDAPEELVQAVLKLRKRS